MSNEALEKQVLGNESITIEDVKQFITDAKKKSQNFINIADRSWNEIERKTKNGRLLGDTEVYKNKRTTRFPLWWSCLKIRQPLVLARLPVGILKDTQGDDPYGRTACILGERLTRGILKTFDAFTEFSSAVDDFLVTDFGWGRVYYKNEEVIEQEKIRLQVVQQPPPEPMLDENGQPMPEQAPPQELPPIFITPDGQQVENPLQDEFGPYILSGQNISVDCEEVYFEAGLYSNLYVDPDVIKWNKVSRIAYENSYSYREFKQLFGQEALDKLEITDIDRHKSGTPICVYEYHDKFLKEVRWFAENSNDFFQPINMKAEEEGENEGPDYSDLYELSGFFPCTEPLKINASTKEFWPMPQYYQLSDLIDDIHGIVNRMVLLTKAIRIRFFFDSSVAELKALIGETGEGGGLGVPNLEQSLMNSNGDLSKLVAYFPVREMIEGLNNMYIAFKQRLDMFYEISGMSDIIRGATNNDIQKTYGERQMEGKFALNRIEPYQRKVQEWIKDQYQLLMEMALKMFSDKSLDEYITPQTLDQEDKERYVQALELLKSNKRRRFRVDFETDSTVAINDQWRKQQATELANTLTKAMESTANVAQTQPELAATELKVLKHLIGEFSDGKLFIDEIQDSIQQVIDKVSQPKEEGPNVDKIKLDLESQKLMFESQKFKAEMQVRQQEVAATNQLEQLRINAENQIQIAKLQQQERFESLNNQLEQIKIGNETGLKTAELSQKAQQLQADIALAQEELSAKRAEFLLQAKELASKTEVKQLELIMDARVAEQRKQLEELYFGLEKEKALLSEKEKWVTEMRLQDEHKINTMTSLAELQKTLKDIKETPVNVKIEQPVKTRKRKKGTIIRDAQGTATEIQLEEID